MNEIQTAIHELQILSHKQRSCQIFTFDQGRVKAKIDNWQGDLWLLFVEVMKKDLGKGLGKKFMNLLVTIADKYKLKIRLEAKAYKKYGLTTEALKSWYSQFGFKQAILGKRGEYIKGHYVCLPVKGMIRKPNVSF